MTEANPDVLVAATVAVAARSLTKRFGSAVELIDPIGISEPTRRNLLIRASTTGEQGDLPASVIVKRALEAGYAPADPDYFVTRRLLNDWVGPRLLSELAPGEGHAPRWLAGDLETGTIVLEDLGADCPSLVGPLLGSDPAAATTALEAYVDRLAGLHVATVGHYDRYAALLAETHAQAQPLLADAGMWSRPLPALTRDLAEIAGISELPPSEVESLVRIAAEPGPFLALVHRDPCPDNVLYVGGTARLIDFEFSRYAHALLDISYLRMGFPTCWCAGRLPEDLVERLEARYRRQIGAACLAATDERFDEALTSICAARLFMAYDWLFEGALQEDRRWGISTHRSRLLWYPHAFAARTAKCNALPGLRALTEALSDHLRQRWPESEPLPLYPAFREERVTAGSGAPSR